MLINNLERERERENLPKGKTQAQLSSAILTVMRSRYKINIKLVQKLRTSTVSKKWEADILVWSVSEYFTN